MFKKIYLFLLFAFLFSFFTSAKTVVKKQITSSNLTEASQRQFDYYFYEGLRLKDLEKYDQAIETFGLCVAIDSLDAGVQSEIGLLYGLVGMNNEALKALEKAVKYDPTNWWYNIRLISMYSELKLYPKSIELTKQLQKIYPNKEEVYNILAALYKETKDYDKAIAANERLESLVGINEQISLEKVQLYYLSNKPKKVMPEIDKLIAKYPTDSRYQVTKGNIYMQQKMPEQAFAIYQKVLVNDPQNANVYISLSEYYNSMNQPDKALESIKTALKTEQLGADTKMQILGQYVEKLVQDTAKFAETESLFKMLVDRYPLEEQVHSYYALFLQYRNRNTEAISEYETMLNINPKNEQSWLHLIQLHIGAKNYNQLMIETARAIKNLPKIPTWYFYRGITQFQLADYRGALASYKEALPLISAEQAALKSDFYSQIADTYFKLEMKDSAFVNYENALAANPKNMMVMNNYAYYLSLEKAELKKAELMSAKTVQLEPKNSTYLDTYAWILYQEGNYSLAKFYIEKAVDNLPKGDESGVVLDHYGDILWMTKDDEKALQMWQKSFDAGNKTNELKIKIENKGWKRE
ncbi:MAG TPA: tetratricopeptide repeat protein [Paludibacter sp.]|nr:tetratricopeptide repeat protein [Paludibacter sp.]